MRFLERCFAIALAATALGCSHVSRLSDAGGDPDAGDDTSTETDEWECASQGADDIGGGCPPGYFCNGDHECDQECITNEQCVTLHGEGWVCNYFGLCVWDDVGGDY